MTGKIKRHIICTIACFALCTVTLIPIHAKPLRKITITHASDFAPYAFLDRDGKPAGILIDIWKLWASRNDVELIFIMTDWNDTIQNIGNGVADIHAGMFRSEGMKNVIDYILPLVRVDASLYVSRSSGITSIKDMDYATVGVLNDDYAQTYLQQNYPNLVLQVFSNNNQLFSALVKGKINSMVSDETQMIYYQYRYGIPGSYRKVDELYSQNLYVGVKKGNKELSNFIQHGFLKVKRNEIYDIEERWILYSQKDIWRTIIRPGMAAAGIILLGVFLVNYIFLRRKVQQKTAALNEELEVRRLIEKQLLDMATHDFLTGLPNRKLIGERLIHALAAARRQKCHVAVFFLDLDGFKMINDEMGHDTGDDLLKMVGGRLMECVRESDSIARLGGDEFAVILETVYDRHEVDAVAQRIISSLSQPYVLKNGIARVTASLGISIYPEHGDSYDELVRHADNAMYRAKYEGKNRYRYFDNQL